MSKLRARWQIYIGYGDDGQVRYYFEDTDPDFLRKVAPGVQYGRAMLYKGRKFVYKLKAHDAIEYCIALNAEDKAKMQDAVDEVLEQKPKPAEEPTNHILPLRTGGSGGGWFPFLFR